MIRLLKTINPDAPVVSGGGLATSNSDLLFKNTDIDITVQGEGEKTMLELCRALEEGRNLDSVAGIRFRENGAVISNDARKNIDNLKLNEVRANEL